MQNAKQNILLVEDNSRDALLFSNILTDDSNTTQYAITHVNCAEKAIEYDIEKEYDIIFLDLNLPGASGCDAINKIQSKSSNIPIVVLTGNDNDVLATRAIKMGCQDYLVKGINNADSIKRSIRYAIDRKGFENKIVDLARYDTLTNLVKREVIYERMEKAISLSKRNGIKLAVFFIDLDNFKHINDTYGHLAGDLVLKETSIRLKQCVRSHDTVARFGGDEFVVLLEGLISEAEDCNVIATRIIKNINKPIFYAGEPIITSGSLGIAIYPECTNNSGDLVMNADAALQAAKQEGKNKYRFFTESLNQKIIRNNNLEVTLRKSLENGDLEPHYHPIVDVSKNRIISAESLARWSCKKFGPVSPLEFIPIAEKSGLINELGELMLKKVCEDYQKIRPLVKQPFKISVNISAKQFDQKDLVDRFINMIEKHNISPKNISFEITENLFLDSNKKVIDMLLKFREAGINLYLDDFGTGYSSLSYLSKLPVDTLKIDKSFISDITRNNNSQVISKAIIGIAKSLNLQVISEGVENKKQLDYLSSIGCNIIQGYYFAKPMPLGQFRKWIEQNSSKTLSDN